MSKEKPPFLTKVKKSGIFFACRLLSVRCSPVQDRLCHAGPGIGAHILSPIGVDHIAVAGIEKVCVADKCVRLDAKDTLFHLHDF